MVARLSTPSNSESKYSYKLAIMVQTDSSRARDTLYASIEPEFKSIDSKRVKLHINRNQNQIVFHLAARDITSLRAAATTLMRLYTVANGVYQFAVKRNG